jgi:hypothetical protein
VSAPIMTAPQVEFLALIEAQVDAHEYLADWLPDAMKVIHFVPDQMCAEAASLTFCRWLFGKPQHMHDAPMWEILALVE